MAASVASGSRHDRIKKSVRRGKLSPAKDSGVRRRPKLLARLAASLTLQIRMFMHRVLRDVDAICMRRASHSMAWPGVGSWRPVVTKAEQEVGSGGNSLG